MSLSRTITGFIILAIIVVPSYIVYRYYIMPDTTEKIHCEQGKFDITFPNKPATSSMDPNSPYKSVSYSCEKYGIELSVSCTEYPSEKEAVSSLSIFMFGDSGVTTYGEEQKILDYQGHQLFQFESGGPISKSYSRELAIGNRRYNMSAYTKNETPYAKEIILDFFDSFEVTDIQDHPPKKIITLKTNK
ncbi:MAG: hypothetical protein ACYTFM_12430 [Planctomycetota bacterium]|jgi:hypothetical protein